MITEKIEVLSSLFDFLKDVYRGIAVQLANRGRIS